MTVHDLSSPFDYFAVSDVNHTSYQISMIFKMMHQVDVTGVVRGIGWEWNVHDVSDLLSTCITLSLAYWID
jgi:hypothetical protein